MYFVLDFVLFALTCTEVDFSHLCIVVITLVLNFPLLYVMLRF